MNCAEMGLTRRLFQDVSIQKKLNFTKIDRSRSEAGLPHARRQRSPEKKRADRNQKFANGAENLVVWLEYKCKYDDISKWHNNTRIRRDVAHTSATAAVTFLQHTHTHTYP